LKLLMHKFLIRFFDVLISFLGLIILFPVFFVIAICISIDSRGGIFYRQSRVGKGNKDFYLLKFRTMKAGSEQQGLLTVGENDRRITRVGFFLRKHKLDELPQLLNVLTGEMSLVGPRPEVRKYVSLYTPEQRKVLEVKPGITDFASIEYSNENARLAQTSSPEQAYINEIMPEKLELNKKFIENQTLSNYFLVILKTLLKTITFRMLFLL
jgi:lipopolysaccharide/colanic/teichoic acid biosynthesis glycosyltransferase